MIKSLFKYRPLDNFTFRLLAEQEIHLSLPKDFNDPFDSMMAFDAKATEEEWRKWVFSHYEFENATRIFIGLQSINFDERRIPFKLNEMMRHEMLVYSMSKGNDKTLMWSHYAEHHKGICLEFEVIDYLGKLGILFEKDNLVKDHITWIGDSCFLYVYDVDYPKRTPELFNLIKDEPGAQPKIEQWLRSKHEDWKYEEEYRIIIPDEWTLSHNLKFKKSSLKSVTFGLCTENYQKEIVTHLIQKHYVSIGFDVKFFRAERIKDTFFIKIVQE